MADNADNAFGAADDDYEEDVVDEGEDGAVDADAAAAPEDPFEVLYKFHPETVIDYAESVIPKIPLQTAPPVEGNDPNHKSPPFLTNYERTKILGTRANQIAEGARPFVVVPEHMSQPLEIAKLELEQRRLPFIIKRPMPDGRFEYWRLSDLLLL